MLLLPFLLLLYLSAFLPASVISEMRYKISAGDLVSADAIADEFCRTPIRPEDDYDLAIALGTVIEVEANLLATDKAVARCSKRSCITGNFGISRRGYKKI